MTFAHFARVLKFLGITIAADEFRLMVKRFAKDGYTINYISFIKSVEEVQEYMDKHGMLDLGGVMLLISNNVHNKCTKIQLKDLNKKFN